MGSDSDQNVFDEIMEQVGHSHKFQKWYNVIFNLFFVGFATMATFNVLIALATPEHWCKVPGREFRNFTVEEWKHLTIPRTSNLSSEFSQCTMFNESGQTSNDKMIIECTHGWEFDKTYYRQTVVSQENWVCHNSLRTTNSIVFGKIGEILGTFVSQLGDVYGRKPILYVAMVTILIGRIGLLFTEGLYLLFVAFLIIGNLSLMPLFQTPLVISVEISSVEDRASIPLMQCVGWTAGLCIAPMIFWAVGSWIPFTIITTIPLAVFLFIPKYNIESPRWLASKGNLKKCLVELKKIAKINNIAVSDKIITTLNKEAFPAEKNYGVMSLFASWNLAKKTLLATLGWVCYTLIYFILYLNVSNLKGNPFVNYFWQGLAELPGYFVGKYLCDVIGRKYTKFVSFIGLAVGGLILAYVLSVSANVIIVSIFGIVMKLVSSIDFYAINLQSIEIYPTCLRQTGTSMGFMVAGIFGIFSPYMIYLGTAVHASLPYVFIAILALIGAVSGMFIPETLNEKLPETISEAEQFGVDQRIWSLPRSKNSTHTIVQNNPI